MFLPQYQPDWRPQIFPHTTIKFIFYPRLRSGLDHGSKKQQTFVALVHTATVLSACDATILNLTMIRNSGNVVILFMDSLQHSLLFVGITIMYVYMYNTTKKAKNQREHNINNPQFSNSLLGRLSNVRAGSLCCLTCPSGLCLKPVSAHPC